MPSNDDVKQAKLPSMPIDPLTDLPYEALNVWPPPPETSKQSNNDDSKDVVMGDISDQSTSGTSGAGAGGAAGTGASSGAGTGVGAKGDDVSKVIEYKRHFPDKMLTGHGMTSAHHAEDILMVSVSLCVAVFVMFALLHCC